jgi:hypothetical protein
MTRNQVRLMVDELAEDARQADPPPAFLHDGPVPRPKNWLGYVQEPLTAGELARVRVSVPALLYGEFSRIIDRLLIHVHEEGR